MRKKTGDERENRQGENGEEQDVGLGGDLDWELRGREKEVSGVSCDFCGEY